MAVGIVELKQCSQNSEHHLIVDVSCDTDCDCHDCVEDCVECDNCDCDCIDCDNS